MKYNKRDTVVRLQGLAVLLLIVAGVHELDL